MFRISGYFLPGSKLGRFRTQAWTRFPSKLVYQIDSGSVIFRCENRSSLTCVSCLGSPPDLSIQKRSPIRVGVETLTTNFEPSEVDRKPITAWLPLVTSLGLPPAILKLARFAWPSLAYTSTMVRPSAAQIGALPPPAR